jgi:hypothetical protein
MGWCTYNNGLSFEDLMSVPVGVDSENEDVDAIDSEEDVPTGCSGCKKCHVNSDCGRIAVTGVEEETKEEDK